MEVNKLKDLVILVTFLGITAISMYMAFIEPGNLIRIRDGLAKGLPTKDSEEEFRSKHPIRRVDIFFLIMGVCVLALMVWWKLGLSIYGHRVSF